MAAQINPTEQSKEAVQILQLIKQGQSFVLSGGAGSGKTYALVEIISNILAEHPLSRVACVTYTNAAVREIEGRISHPNLRTSTIHDFLWDSIKHFQLELKEILLELINDEENTTFKVLNKKGEPEKLTHIDGAISYKEYVRLREGVVSHDEIIYLSNEIFKRHDKLCRLLKDCYPVILVDEYQDTRPEVVKILLDYLPRDGKSSVVGFFGDAMQAIYDDGIGDLEAYKGEGLGKVVEVKREQNRRNPLSVIGLANLLRNDGLTQIPSEDSKAPNMGLEGKVKPGTMRFIYSTNNDINVVKKYLAWDFSGKGESKELNLTHNLIAAKAGFERLMKIYDSEKILEYVDRVKKYIKKNDPDLEVEGKTFNEVVEGLRKGKAGKELTAVNPTPVMQTYIDEHEIEYQAALGTSFAVLASIFVDKDQLIDDQKSDKSEVGRGGRGRDDLIKHLFKIEKNIRLYTDKNYNEFLRVTEHKIYSHQDKLVLKSKISKLSDPDDRTIAQIIEEADGQGVVRVDDKLNVFKEKKAYIYNQITALPYSQFQKLYDYVEGFTPFSTQHKTKGREFSNVLVVLDNGQWNSYNFEYLFLNRVDKESVVDRTRKIMYVCCTRAKDNLAVFYHAPSTEIVKAAEKWFGAENMINIDKALAA